MWYCFWLSEFFSDNIFNGLDRETGSRVSRSGGCRTSVSPGKGLTSNKRWGRAQWGRQLASTTSLWHGEESEFSYNFKII